jgi:peptidoglycan LD-endopeptidase LytH
VGDGPSAGAMCPAASLGVTSHSVTPAVRRCLVACGLLVSSAPSLSNAAADAPTLAAGGAQAAAPAERLGKVGEIMFPMNPVPRCEILDNFGDPRSGGRSHQGTDILATLGQEVYAVADGVLTKQYVAGGPSASLSGNAWQLDLPDGGYFFYGHLSAFASGLSVGSAVTKGQLIGYVGDTGNPGPGNYHLHFEYHPGGGAAINVLSKLTIPPQCSVY